MSRILLAAVLGGIAVFVWGFVYWTVLPLPPMVLKSAPDELRLVSALTSQNLQSGTYYLPAMPHDPDAAADQQTLLMEDWTTRHEAGPIALIHFRKDGVPPMQPLLLVRGLVINMLFAGFLAVVVSRTLSFGTTFGKRLAVAASTGLAAVCVTDLLQWNFFYVPAGWTGLLALDHFMGFVVAGLVIAAIVKPGVAVKTTVAEATAIDAV